MKLGVLAVAILSVFPASAATGQCKNNPRVVGACYVVHGRATFGPGTPALRIWPIGTHRMLGVTAGPIADDADDPIAPKNMLVGPNVQGIFGDFEVCPFTPEQKGHMQMVCVESAKKLVVKRWPSKQR